MVYCTRHRRNEGDPVAFTIIRRVDGASRQDGGAHMPKGRNQKLKLLYLYKILSEQTDDNVSLNAAELCDELEKYGVSAERKSIYDDIEALRLYGLDIVLRPEKGGGYYLGERPFQTSELKMLIDIVQAARFISEKKSAELIEKIRAMAPVSEKRSLMRSRKRINRNCRNASTEGSLRPWRSSG